MPENYEIQPQPTADQTLTLHSFVHYGVRKHQLAWNERAFSSMVTGRPEVLVVRSPRGGRVSISSVYYGRVTRKKSFRVVWSRTRLAIVDGLTPTGKDWLPAKRKGDGYRRFRDQDI